jgi:hypothetical protein
MEPRGYSAFSSLSLPSLSLSLFLKFIYVFIYLLVLGVSQDFANARQVIYNRLVPPVLLRLLDSKLNGVELQQSMTLEGQT